MYLNALKDNCKVRIGLTSLERSLLVTHFYMGLSSFLFRKGHLLVDAHAFCKKMSTSYWNLWLWPQTEIQNYWYTLDYSQHPGIPNWPLKIQGWSMSRVKETVTPTKLTICGQDEGSLASDDIWSLSLLSSERRRGEPSAKPSLKSTTKRKETAHSCMHQGTSSNHLEHQPGSRKRKGVSQKIQNENSDIFTRGMPLPHPLLVCICHEQ